LLGVLPNSPNFRHHEDNRLAYDIVLIDEVSMVDLPLMTRVFRALKDTAKVILLGDADQLPSVAAGSVLADIAPRPHGGFSLDNDQYLTQVCQLSVDQLSHYFSAQKQRSNSIQGNESRFDYLSFLVKSRRFDGKGGIGLIANSVIDGDVKSSWQLLNNAEKTGQLSLAQGELSSWLAPLVKQYYQPIESCEEVNDAFVLLSQFRVLCATRQGDYGVEQINEVIKSYLGKNNTPFQQQTLYHGQPIMINENDYRLGLYNGDIGIIWRVVDQEGKEHLMACFEDGLAQNDKVQNKEVANTENSGQVIRQILPSRLPKFESVYAMTIHKTQGSEFSHVAMVLSATQSVSLAGQQEKQKSGSKLLSRELLYTGITRAKKQLTIAANQRIWQQGVTAQVQRHSGLRLCETVAK
jgi:exodeoxyribonuclease V alpha subunit